MNTLEISDGDQRHQRIISDREHSCCLCPMVHLHLEDTGRRGTTRSPALQMYWSTSVGYLGAKRNIERNDPTVRLIFRVFHRARSSCGLLRPQSCPNNPKSLNKFAPLSCSFWLSGATNHSCSKMANNVVAHEGGIRPNSEL